MVKTWDRPVVQIDADPALEATQAQVPVDISSVPILATTALANDGTPITLRDESFVVANLPRGPRQVIRLNGDKVPGIVYLTVPASTAVLVIQSDSGHIGVNDYTGGTFILRMRIGSISLNRVGGAGFAQVIRGQVVVRNSNLDRLRVRTALAPILFDRCRVRQVEATSVYGSIVYDNGSFEPGLARFESTNGNVAIGADGAAQLTAASNSGRIYTQFDHGAQIEGGRDGQTHATVNGGGPVVTATSATGNVYLYDGSLKTRATVAPEWSQPADLMMGRLHPFAPRASEPSSQVPGSGSSFSPVPPRNTFPTAPPRSAWPTSWPARNYSAPFRGYATPRSSYPGASRTDQNAHRAYVPQARPYQRPREIRIEPPPTQHRR